MTFTRVQEYIPQGRLLRLQLFRAGLTWVCLHVFLALVTGSEVLELSARAYTVFVLAASTIGFLEARRRSEILLLNNLGVGTIPVILGWVLGLLFLEAALHLVRRDFSIGALCC